MSHSLQKMTSAFLGGDPFNMPMQGRGDTMSLSTINQRADNVKTNTSKFTTMRGVSNNLTTNDIEGMQSPLSQREFPLSLKFDHFVTYRCPAKTSRLQASQQARIQQPELGHRQIRTKSAPCRTLQGGDQPEDERHRWSPPLGFQIPKQETGQRSPEPNLQLV